MGREIVFALYRPRRGKGNTARLLRLVRKHHPTLVRRGLATPRKPVICRAEDGTVVEVFEWASAAAMRKAHRDPAVLAIWGPMEKVAVFTTLHSLAESKNPFSHFKPLDGARR